MEKMKYESPELIIRWFESEDVIAMSEQDSGYTPGDDIGDEW